MEKLAEPEIAERLSINKGWERLGDMLVKNWQFASASRALDFVNRVSGLAQLQEHHPEIVLSYREVRIELSTHAVGGITDADFHLAAAIDQLPSDR